ncbi:MAG: 30S ribosomal protein S6 [Candidatus Uhrbacteria bacterium]|nr:30S ribosomal protein S6 [Patescibacteria group bacterium]MBU1907169.1 30S ribosomal protein S6 [Patescibacteria group bacterium]
MKYELLYIVSSAFSDTEVAEEQTNVTALIEEAGGSISRDEVLGKIKLAYPINKQRHGTYILVHFEAETSIIRALEAKLRMSEEVLRHTIAKLVPGTEDKKYELASYVPPLTAEGKPSTPRVRPGASKLAPPPPSKTEETAPKMSVEELDKKLDEILESDVLKDI